MNDYARVGYSDFMKICHVDEENDTTYFGGFRVEGDGLYVNMPHAGDRRTLTPEERSESSWHPTGEYDKPALSLPCTLGQLRAFVDEAGLLGCIDEVEVDALQVAVPDTPAGATADCLIELNNVPGKMPRTAMGKLAIEAAWQSELRTKRAATAKQVMKLLQEWADDGKEPENLLKSDKQNNAVIWITGKRVSKIFGIEACGKALETWQKSRA